MNAVSDLAAVRAYERRLRQAVVQGIEANLYTHVGDDRGCIRAETLIDVCTDVAAEGTVRDPIVVAGAHVQGRLDLAETRLAHAIRFRDCLFDDGIDLCGARATEALEWEGGRIGGIVADRFKTTSDLIIRSVEVTGQVSLHWADIGGDLCFTGSHLKTAEKVVALRASDVRVGCTLFLDGTFQSQGEVCLRSSHIKGDVDCRHAHFDANGAHYSIDAAHAVIDGELLCEQGFFSTGEVRLQWAQIQRLRATGGTFSSKSNYALHATAMRVFSGVYLDRDFHATAEVRLIGATIIGDLCCTNGHFDNPDGVALNAERIVADDVYLDDGFTADGEVRFVDAHVAHQFNATDGVFHKASGVGDYALDADGLHCGGDVYLDRGFEATGTVSLTGAEIGSELNCTNGHFTSLKPHGYALFADGLTTPGVIYLDKDFQAHGEVRLARATVGRQLVCTGGLFENKSHVALDLAGLIAAGDVLLNGEEQQEQNSGQGAFRAIGKVILRGANITRDLDFSHSSLGDLGEFDARGMTVGGRLIWKMAVPMQGPIDLSRAEIGRLDDDSLANWPDGKYMLDGIIFRILDGTRARQGKSMSVEDRIRWLDRTSEYSQGAYRQLAESYQLSGDDASAEKILIACQRHQRTRGYPKKARKSTDGKGERKLFSKGWSWLLEVTVGYGYRLHRVFIFLLALWALGFLFYWLGANADLIHLTQDGHPSTLHGCEAGFPCFSPPVYSLQMLIPGLDLREAAYWLPNAEENPPWGALLMAYTWIMIISGWIAVTVVAAGLTRVFRRR